MNKKNDFGFYLKEQLKNRKVKKYYDEFGKQLEIAYQISELRKKRGVSQEKLAEKIGTTQSNIARMEAGRQNFSTSTLFRVAKALGKELKVEFL